MKISKYLNPGNSDKELIWQFAFLGRREDLDSKLEELATMAEKEEWTSSGSSSKNDILHSYIKHTFDKAAKDDLIEISEDENYSCFNTGLLTENGEDILCLFNKFTSSETYAWHLMGFRKESDREIIGLFDQTPKVVSYFENPSKIYFNPEKELIKNLDHILDDNFDRFPESLKSEGKETISALLQSALDLTLKRCKRNYRIAVPQYYKDNITYLLPVKLKGCVMSLAVEEINGRYRANTIFTLEMAYKNARLLMKPEADWLTLATKEAEESPT